MCKSVYFTLWSKFVSNIVIIILKKPRIPLTKYHRTKNPTILHPSVMNFCPFIKGGPSGCHSKIEGKFTAVKHSKKKECIDWKLKA